MQALLLWIAIAFLYYKAGSAIFWLIIFVAVCGFAVWIAGSVLRVQKSGR